MKTFNLATAIAVIVGLTLCAHVLIRQHFQARANELRREHALKMQALDFAERERMRAHTAAENERDRQLKREAWEREKLKRAGRKGHE